jgi:hypothetical protein
VIAFGLVGLRLGKVGHSLIEYIAAAQVAADLCGVTGAGMRARKGCPTYLDIHDECCLIHKLDFRRQLHVSQLANVVVASAQAAGNTIAVLGCSSLRWTLQSEVMQSDGK